MTWVLITGGAGFIGTNLCQKLLEKGTHVIALDNHITSSQGSENIFTGNPAYRFIHHDITQKFPTTLNPEEIRIETIYHLACPTGVPNVITLAEEMALTCSVGTMRVLELAQAHKADVVFASSSEVYGNPQITPQAETYTGNVLPIGIRSPYEEGKRFSETLVEIYVKKYHLNAKIMRIFNTYGPHMARSDTRVIPTFIRQLSLQQPLTIYGEGDHARTFCYIDDLIKGIMLIQQRGISGEVYNLGSSEEYTIRQLAEMLIALCKSDKGIQYKKQPIEDHDRRIPLLEKVKTLGWVPKVSLQEGLQLTLTWYGF